MAEISDKSKLFTAKVAHQVNQAIRDFYGEDSLPDWDTAGNEMRHRGVLGVEQIIANPDMTPKEIHNIWMQNMFKDGWRAGPVHDGVKKTHPNLVLYEELDDAQKLKDVIYLTLVKTMIGQ